MKTTEQFNAEVSKFKRAMVPTSLVAIADGNGYHFVTVCSTAYKQSEIHNLKAKINPAFAKCFDVESAIVVDVDCQ